MTGTTPRARGRGLRALATLASAALVVSGGCRIEPPFARTNPLDPDHTLEITLDGPDSVHSVQQTLTYTLASDPQVALEDYSFLWKVYSDLVDMFTGRPIDATDIISTGAGTVRVLAATSQYRKHTVVARFNLREVGHVLYSGQKAVTLELSCSPWTQPENDCTTTYEVDSLISVHPRATDPGGHPLGAIQHGLLRSQVILRNAGIVARELGTGDPLPYVRLRATGVGSTWVVVRMDEATDSVLVTVTP